MIDEEPCESVRFWRLNSLAALSMTRWCERDAQDPEDLQAIKASNATFSRLQAREKAVQTRAKRIIDNRKPDR